MNLSLASYRKIIDSFPEGVYISDLDSKIIYWNKAAEEISGYRSEEVLGRSCSQNLLCHLDTEGTSLCAACPLSRTMAGGDIVDTELSLHHKDGHRVPISARLSPLQDDEGRVIGGVMTFSDASARLDHDQRLKELEKLALLDQLTQLANRRYLERELDARLEELRRYGIPFGVMFMDIDDFKRVNDGYGHETGDRVLQYIAATFRSHSRPFDLYGRWGGEEFLGIARNVTKKDLRLMAERLCKLVEKSFLVLGQERLQVTISIGATLATEADTLTSLVHRADLLMYRSKAAGKDCVTQD